MLNRELPSGDCDHKASLNHVCEFGESANATKREQLCIKGSCERDEVQVRILHLGRMCSGLGSVKGVVLVKAMEIAIRRL